MGLEDVSGVGDGPMHTQSYSNEDILDSIREFYKEEEGSTTASEFDKNPDTPSYTLVKQRFGSWYSALSEAGISGVDTSECPECGNLYESLGLHFSKSGCERPEPSDKVLQLLTGSMMGDAWSQKRHKHTRIKIEMVNKSYLWEVDKILGGLSAGFVGQREKDVGRDTVTVATIAHPQFDIFNWYNESGDKEFPSDIILTPTVLKHWYAQDGSVAWGDKNTGGAITIRATNEDDGEEKILSMFEKVGLEPSFNSAGSIRFGVDDSEEVLDYMGGPPRGFEYKWEIDDRRKYEYLKG